MMMMTTSTTRTIMMMMMTPFTRQRTHTRTHNIARAPTRIDHCAHTVIIIIKYNAKGVKIREKEKYFDERKKETDMSREELEPSKEKIINK